MIVLRFQNAFKRGLVCKSRTTWENLENTKSFKICQIIASGYYYYKINPELIGSLLFENWSNLDFRLLRAYFGLQFLPINAHLWSLNIYPVFMLMTQPCFILTRMLISYLKYAQWMSNLTKCSTAWLTVNKLSKSSSAPARFPKQANIFNRNKWSLLNKTCQS